MKKKKEMSSYQVCVAAEAFAAALFARAGFHVSVQYGANQPGYDLIVEKDGKTLLISVKGSQDGSWGLTQDYLKDIKKATGKTDYHLAADEWAKVHGKNIVFCFVQFKNKSVEELPDVCLLRTREVAEQLKICRGGFGDTILYLAKKWIRGKGAGNEYNIPAEWRFSLKRASELFS